MDPTGGGNAFLGGLLAGLLISDGDFRVGAFTFCCSICFRSDGIKSQQGD